MNKNKQSVLGRSLSDGNLQVSKDGGDVDAITAATISEPCFSGCCKPAYSAYAGTKNGMAHQELRLIQLIKKKYHKLKQNSKGRRRP